MDQGRMGTRVFLDQHSQPRHLPKQAQTPAQASAPAASLEQRQSIGFTGHLSQRASDFANHLSASTFYNHTTLYTEPFFAACNSPQWSSSTFLQVKPFDTTSHFFDCAFNWTVSGM